jgi:hypothetical protein
MYFGLICTFNLWLKTRLYFFDISSVYQYSALVSGTETHCWSLGIAQNIEKLHFRQISSTTQYFEQAAYWICLEWQTRKAHLNFSCMRISYTVLQYLWTEERMWNWSSVRRCSSWVLVDVGFINNGLKQWVLIVVWKVLRVFGKLWKSCVMSVCLSVLMKQLDFHWTDFREIVYVFLENLSRKFKFY